MASDSDDVPYRDASLPVPDRVDDLLSRMTTAEKIGQLVGVTPKMTDGIDDAADVKDAVDAHGFGSVAPFGHGLSQYDTPREAAEVATDIQRHAVEETRLGIPLLFYLDADHGHAYIKGSTVFPHNIGMAATGDTDLVERAASVTASEMAATGVHQNLNPVCDVARDVRWGRTFETFGESPFLCAAFGSAAVRGYQGEDLSDPGSVVATPKHFPAYSEPERGEDASPVDVSEYTLRRVFLPPFEAAIEAGAESIMPCYNALEGYPVHGSREHLTGLLREELGFDGYVVTDWGGIDMLHEDHRTAESTEEAVRQAYDAGINISSIAGPEYVKVLTSLREQGIIAESLIDDRVRDVLSAKFRLGLFEDPYVDPEAAVDVLGTEDHRDVARECARASMTLLTNRNDRLPLDRDLDVAVVGPNADDLRNQFGGWSSVDEPLPPGVTVRDGVEAAVSDDGSVTYELGCGPVESDDVEAARDAAADADVTVAAVGETGYLHEFARSDTANGEFPTRTELSLPEAQRELLEAVADTGTPLVVVVVSGRPLAIEWTADHASAVLWAYQPGSEGGRAVADVLFGDYNPSGHLPVSIPRSIGHLPTRFNHLPHPRPLGEEEHPSSYDPLFPFGHGLSYTDFEYELSVPSTEVGPAESVTVDVEVTNTGDRDGHDVVHLYASDDRSSRVTPVRELVGIDRVHVEAGDSTTASLTVSPESIGVIGDDNRSRPEAGTVELTAGDRSVSLEVRDPTP